MAGRHNGQHQGGAALLMFMVLAVMATLTYLVNSVSSAEIELKRQRKTEAALALAKDALIGYALTYRDRMAAQDTNFTDDDDAAMYGYLPMPDIGKRGTTTDENCKDSNGRPMEGCQAPPSPSGISKVDDANGDGTNDYLPTLVGRFPWRTLGVPPLRDGYGECLWLIVSSLALSGNATQTKFDINWDTLGHIDIQTADGTDTLESLYASKPYDRPWAVVFSPGPRLSNQNRAKQSKGGDPRDEDDVTECGGNYDARNYLDPFDLNALNGTKNTLANFYHASDDPNDHETRSNTPIPITAGGNLSKSGSEFKLEACVNANCEHLSNDIGLTITGAGLFSQVIRNNGFRSDLRSMLGNMANCWSTELASLTPVAIAGYTPPAGKIAGRIPDAPTSCNTLPPLVFGQATAYGNDQNPLGYFDHYRKMIFIAKPTSGTLAVNGKADCKGVILFSGPRQPGQTRIGADENNLSNYLEGDNLASLTSTGSIFSGDSEKTAEAPQANGTDIAVCIPDPNDSGRQPSLVNSPTLPPDQQIVRIENGTLILGRENSTTGVLGSAAASALFGCTWLPDTRSLGNGLRAFFTLQFKRVGTNVGSNGIVFALVDAARNTTGACGAAGNHLGYSGINPSTPSIAAPKLGIEFDQSRNSSYTSSTSLTAGRRDPCYTCGNGTADTHVAIVYWGNAGNNPTDGVTQPIYDDNVHGFPLTPPVLRPPPSNPDEGNSGVAPVNLRGYPDNSFDSRLLHIRVELSPIRTNAANAEDRSIRLRTQVWVLADSATVINQIAALQNTTRPLDQLYPGFAPTVSDTASIYDIAETGSSCDISTPCPSSQACGSDGVCYRPAFQALRMGFAGSQRTTDQDVRITNFYTTWLE